MNKKRKIIPLVISAYAAFIAISFIIGFKPGRQIADNFSVFAKDMLKILPSAFILIGLMDIWIKKETVAKHLGKDSGILAHIWMILLAATTVGGLYVAFPVAYLLQKKGAKLELIFTYIAASAICRIPMAIFEISFMGIKFTLIRLLVSLPLVILSSIVLGNYLAKRNYQIADGK